MNRFIRKGMAIFLSGCVFALMVSPISAKETKVTASVPKQHEVIVESEGGRIVVNKSVVNTKLQQTVTVKSPTGSFRIRGKRFRQWCMTV